MEVYWLLALITILINLFPVRNMRQYTVRLVVSLVPLFLYGAFRVNYGLDYEAYLDFFNETNLYGEVTDDRMETGYTLLNKYVVSFQQILILQTLLLCASYYCLFKWYIPAKYAWLGFLLLFLSGPVSIFFMLSGIRNGIAISIFILSTRYIYQRKILPFAVLVFIAYWFHNSIIMMTPIAYFVGNSKQISTQSLIIWLSVMVILFFASVTVLMGYVELIINAYFDKYSTYVEGVQEQSQGAGFLIALFSLGASALVLNSVKDTNLSAKELMTVKLMLLFFLAFLLGPLNFRMSQYFIPFFVTGSVIMLPLMKTEIIKYAYFIIIFAYSVYALNLWLDNPFFSYDTYESVLLN